MAEGHLKRELGLLHATMMGIGGAIRAGVFVTLGYASTLAGTGLIIAVVLCGIINLFTMLSYAELGAALPSAGGEYTFAKVAFGGFLSFATGWFEWLSNMFYAAFSAVGFAYLVSYVVPAVNVPLLAVLIIAVFTAINVKGVKETGLSQTLMTLFMLSLLGIFIVCGLFTDQIAGSLDLNAPQGFLGVLRASAFIFVVYLGGEAIAVAQGEIKNPGKTIPRAILLTCVTLIVIYSATVFVVRRVVPPESLIGKASPLAYVAEQFMGPLGVVIVTVAGIVAAVSSVNTSTMAHSRVAYALARDGYFPKGFFNVHKPFKVPLYPLTPILGIATSLMLIFFLEPGTLLIGLELFVFGLVAYYIRMVGYYRISLAAGGMNFGISVFSALIACLIASGAVPILMSESVRWLATSGAALVSVIYLVAGLLNITRREE